MRRKLAAALAALVVLAASVVAAPEAAAAGPLLNVYEHSNYGGAYVAQFQASNCGTAGASSRQEYWIGWPARLQGSSFEAITAYPYCNVFGVHAYGGGWYQACTMSRKRWFGDYGMSWFGSSQVDGWFNDNTDAVMVGYYSGCPLNN